MRSRYPWPLSALPPSCAAALLGMGGAAGPTTSYTLERRSTGDGYLQTEENWNPGGDWAVLAIVDPSELEGTGTVLDFGGTAASKAGAVMRCEPRSGNDAYEFVLQTNGGTLTRSVFISGEWADAGPTLLWMHIQPAASNGQWRYGVGASGANEDSGTAGGGIPSAEGDGPVTVWQRAANDDNGSSGTLAFAVLDTMPSDAQLDALAADPTAANLRALVATLVGAGATELLGLQTTDTGAVSTVTDPSGSYAWNVVQGSEPVHIPGTLPSYSLGDIVIAVEGQSNGEGSHSTSPPAMTLGTYTLTGTNGTNPLANDYGVELGFIAAADGWTTDIEIAQCAVGGSNIASWQTGGANRTTADATQGAMTGTITDILWVHGESAALGETAANDYEQDLRDYIAQRKAAIPGVRIHVAAMGSLPGGYPYRDTVAAAIETVAGDTADVYLVSVDGLTKIADNVHYDGGSTRALGGRLALSVAQAMS